MAKKIDTENDQEGTNLMMEPLEVLACLVPKNEQSHPDIIEGKKDELKKFEEFQAYEWVKDDGQHRIGL